MIKMNKLLILLIISAFVLSCTNKKGKRANELPTYQIGFDNTDNFNFDNEIDTSFYIPLETDKSNLLGKISKVQIDSVIAILDELNQTLHVYSMEGKLLNVIDKRGNGPEEYAQISDFFLSSKDGYIEVLDAMQLKIIRYNIMGDFINEMKLPFSVGISRFVKKDGYYIFDQQTRRNEKELKYSLLVLSPQGKIINKIFPYERSADILFSSRKTFYYVDNKLHYLPIYCDTIFSIEGEKAIPMFRIDFSDKWTDKSVMYSKVNNPMDFINKIKNSNFITFLNVLETNSTIWIDFIYKEKKYCSIIDKLSSHISTYSNDESKDCGTQIGTILTTWNNYFVIPESAEKMIEQFDIKTDSEDNPFLIFVKFK